MSNIKVTIIFEQSTAFKNLTSTTSGREAGWTEGFIQSAADVNQQALVTAANSYLTARLPLLASQAKVVGYRFHDLSTNATRAYPFNYNQFGTGGDCTLPQAAILMRFYAQNQINNRPLELRGVPASFLSTGELIPGSPPSALWRALGAVVTTWYGMLGVNKSNPRNKVATVTAAGVVTTKAGLMGLTNGDTVQFYRTKPNGTCCGSIGQFPSITITGAQQFSFTPPTGFTGGFGGTVAAWNAPAFMPFDQTSTANVPNGYGIERLVIRKTGRPFDLFSGRRSRKCCKC